MSLVSLVKNFARGLVWLGALAVGGCASEPRFSRQDFVSSYHYGQQSELFKSFVSEEDYVSFSRSLRLDRLVEFQSGEDKELLERLVRDVDSDYLFRFMDEFEGLDDFFPYVLKAFVKNDVDIDRVLDVMREFDADFKFSEVKENLKDSFKGLWYQQFMAVSLGIVKSGISNDEVREYLALKDGFGNNLSLRTVSNLAGKFSVGDVRDFLGCVDVYGASLKQEDLWHFLCLKKVSFSDFSEYVKVFPIEVLRSIDLNKINRWALPLFERYTSLKRPDGSRVFDLNATNIDTLVTFVNEDIRGVNALEAVLPFVYEIKDGVWTSLEQSRGQWVSGVEVSEIPKVREGLAAGKSLVEVIFNLAFGDRSNFSNNGKPKVLVSLPTSDYNGSFTDYYNSDLYKRLDVDFDVKYIFTYSEDDLYAGIASCRDLDDLAMIFISGHGNKSGIELASGDDEKSHFNVDDKEIKEYISGLKSKPVLFANACSSGVDSVVQDSFPLPSVARFLHELTGLGTYGSKTDFGGRDVRVIPGLVPRVVIVDEENTVHYK